MYIFVLQLFNDALVLLAPLLLKLLVEWLSLRPESKGQYWPMWQQLLLPKGRLFGWTAAMALGLSCILRAILSSHFNWRLVSSPLVYVFILIEVNITY